MASAWLSKSVSSMLSRALYITVEPMPRTFSERRAVLEALKQHGSVSFFIRLHDPSSFISVAESPRAAQVLINASPLEFSVARSPSNRLAPLPILTDTPDDPVLAEMPSGADEKATFVAQAFPAEERALWNLLRPPHAGPWPKIHGPFHRDSASTVALRSVVPDDLAAGGLCDWETASVRPSERNTIAANIQRRQLQRERKAASRSRNDPSQGAPQVDEDAPGTLTFEEKFAAAVKQPFGK